MCGGVYNLRGANVCKTLVENRETAEEIATKDIRDLRENREKLLFERAELRELERFHIQVRPRTFVETVSSPDFGYMHVCKHVMTYGVSFVCMCACAVCGCCCT